MPGYRGRRGFRYRHCKGVTTSPSADLQLIKAATIRTLQRKLYTKAKQGTVFCHVLYVRVRRRDILSRANKRRM